MVPLSGARTLEGVRFSRPQAGRAALIAALLLLLLMGACLLYVLPRQVKTSSERGALMTRFMEQDYVCCDLAYARSNPRCAGVLKDVAALSRGAGGPGFAGPA